MNEKVKKGFIKVILVTVLGVILIVSVPFLFGSPLSDKFNAFMLGGWTPIMLIGIAFSIMIFLISLKVSRRGLFTISNVLSLLCFGIILYSIFFVGGWKGMGIGFVTISIFIGIWIGTVIGALVKK